MGYKATTLEGRIQELESKIDLLLVIAREALEYSASDKSAGETVKIRELCAQLDRDIRNAVTCHYASVQRDDDRYKEFEARKSGVKVFGIDVENGGSFRFSPEHWDYGTGDRVQWVSKTGPFTVVVNPLDSSESFASPFVRELDPTVPAHESQGERKIHAHKDEKENIWKTYEYYVKSLFSPTEDATRKIVGAVALTNRFSVSLNRGDKILVNHAQRGYDC